ncbi:predicted protein [Chaetoceros tenuissimus]|uniref:Uncharacterized protein n=1 Tax=Chaetoceros tenuissimus TaxID=426638 RepID=A0AAD3DB56_9STRA|nr:predicted protein [Chaetoceros tenuissimus]
MSFYKYLIHSFILNNCCRCLIYSTRQRRSTLAKKDQLVVKCKGPREKLALVTKKGFAFPYHPTDPSQFVYLSREHAKALISRKEVSLQEYQQYLNENKTNSVQVQTFGIPKVGLRIEYEPDESQVQIKPSSTYRTSEPIEHFESGGITLSHYIHQKCINITCRKSFLQPFVKTFNFFSFKRSGADSLGTNYYQSINQSTQPNPTARKGPSTIEGSAFWRETWDPTWLPLCNKVVNELVKFSLELEVSFCPLTDCFNLTVYKAANCVVSQNRFGSINILTFGDKYLIGFSNEEHVDTNDWLGEDIDVEVEKLVYQLKHSTASLKKNIQSYKDYSNKECQLRLKKYVKLSNAVKYLLKLGKLGGKHRIPRYETPTTCGYKFVDERMDLAFEICAYFLHPSIGVAVRLVSNIFHWFRAARHTHHTSVPVLFCKEKQIITFNDSCMGRWWIRSQNPALRIVRKSLQWQGVIKV